MQPVSQSTESLLSPTMFHRLKGRGPGSTSTEEGDNQVKFPPSRNRSKGSSNGVAYKKSVTWAKELTP